MPVQFIAHGKPDRILANLGLDAEGIAATVVAALNVSPADAVLAGLDALDVSAELELALSLADAADAVTRPRFRARDLVVQHKADAVVTEADRGCPTPCAPC